MLQLHKDSMSTPTIYGRWLNKHGHIEYFRDGNGKSRKGWSVPAHLKAQEDRARELSARKLSRRTP